MNHPIKSIVYYLSLSFFLFSFSLAGQNFSRLPAEFIINNQTLANPLTGGLNAPQLSAVDLNFDGILDLYIFDRVGNIHLTFLNAGTPNESSYTFAPAYSEYFPSCVNWVTLRDFDGDGAFDLFTHGGNEGVDGVRVFKGKNTIDKLDFERLNFDPSFAYNVLSYPDPGGFTKEIFISDIDYADFNDLDADNDLDILAFSPSGGHVYFFQNQSVEQGYGVDSLIFELKDDCWGRFFEADLSEEIMLGNDINMCPPGLLGPAKDRHQGSTLLSFDENGDMVREIVIGDVSNENLFKLTNGGTIETAFMIAQDNEFPNYDVPTSIPFFPAAFHLDLDNDGLKDFVACPNDRGATHDYEVIWQYKNTESAEDKVFELQQKDWLVHEMLDFGTNAFPTFVDVNADSLLDLVVGNFGYFKEDGSQDAYLILFENIGTKTIPKFELTDDNWLNFNQFSNDPVNFSWSFAPTFGDLDGDGDLDLLVGERFGRLIFVENTAGEGNPMSFDVPVFEWQEIGVGQNARPQIIDLNRDGLLDLVIGERRGKLFYFQNQGTVEIPEFNPDFEVAPNSDFLGEVKAVSNILVGNLTPVVLDVETDFNIIFGWENGTIQLYNNVEDNLEGQFTLVDDFIGEIYEGAETAPALADLNSDGFFEMMVGTRRGGLSLYGTNIKSGIEVSTNQITEDFSFQLFPNPTNGHLNLELESTSFQNSECRILTATGKVVFQQKLITANTNINVKDLPVSIYFCQIFSEYGMVTKRFVKTKS